MIVKRPGLLTLTAAAVLSAGLALPAQAADRSNVYQPFDCSGDDCVDVGESRLLRSADGIVATVTTSRLRKGQAYSLWWVVFNNPEACAPGPCNVEDLSNEDTQPTAIWGSGAVVGDFGTGNQASGQFTAVLNKDETPLTEEQSLEDAEILLVIRSHGRALRSGTGDQITDYNGGCSVDVTPAVPKKRGECANVQFAIHSTAE